MIIPTLTFLRPHLLYLLPLWIVLWGVLTYLGRKENSIHHVDKHLEAYSIQKKQGRFDYIYQCIVLLCGLGIIVLLCGPSLYSQQQKIYQPLNARVFLIDVSPTMWSEDLKPNRIAQVQIKIRQILDQNPHIPTALAVFSGHGFFITPVTTDHQTIKLYIKTLTPSAAPSVGQNLASGLETAQTLLKNALVPRGEILVFTAIENAAPFEEDVRAIRKLGHSVSFINCGTREGAPLYKANHKFDYDTNNALQFTRPDSQGLIKLSKIGGGHYSVLQGSESVFKPHSLQQNQTHGTQTIEVRSDLGPYLAIFFTPFFLLCFRKHILSLFFIICSFSMADSVWCLEKPWWQSQHSYAEKLLKEGLYIDAINHFKDKHWKAYTEILQKNYSDALAHLENAHSFSEVFNKGIALAHLKEYKKAHDIFSKLLESHPHDIDVQHNKDVLDKILKISKNDTSQQEDDKKSNEEQSDNNKNSEKTSSSDKKENSDTPKDSEDIKSQPDDKNNIDKEQKDNEEPQSTEQKENSSSEDTSKLQQADTQKPPPKNKEKEQYMSRVQRDPSHFLKRKLQKQLDQIEDK